MNAEKQKLKVPCVIKIGELFNGILESGVSPTVKDGYEILKCDGIQIQTLGGYSDLKHVSRHKTTKDLVRIFVKSKNVETDVTVTTDHICMVYNRNHFFENTDAKNIKIGDFVSVYEENSDREAIGEVVEIETVGPTDDYVYDCEVEDSHTFYANDILIHNSQFVNLECVSDWFKKKCGFSSKMIDWSDEQKIKFWNFMNDFVENDLNRHVQELIRDECHTENSKVLRYSLEYIADIGIYESKKHYGVRKVLSDPGPKIVDKIKYSGIELKKGNIPPTAKEFLSTIYEGVLRNDWTSEDYRKYLNTAYERYRKLDITEISFWKGYGTEREAAGFLEMKKGTTGISKACTFYNQIIDKMGIGGRYDTLRPGNKARFCYIKPTNKYRINVIAFVDGQYPEEFRGLFEPDYDVMFEKMILDPLKNFLKACGFKKSDPRNCNLMEVDDL